MAAAAADLLTLSVQILTLSRDFVTYMVVVVFVEEGKKSDKRCGAKII